MGLVVGEEGPEGAIGEGLGDLGEMEDSAIMRSMTKPR